MVGDRVNSVQPLVRMTFTIICALVFDVRFSALSKVIFEYLIVNSVGGFNKLIKIISKNNAKIKSKKLDAKTATQNFD